jgi:hypothetical protein
MATGGREAEFFGGDQQDVDGRALGGTVRLSYPWDSQKKEL